MLLSSIWATVKMRILHFLHTWMTKTQRCYGRKWNGSQRGKDGRINERAGGREAREDILKNCVKEGFWTRAWRQELQKQNNDLWVLKVSQRYKLTLCCRRRKGSSISMPPSWTTHHTSMVPSPKRSRLVGKLSTFLATSKAWWAAVDSRTVSGWTEGKCCGYDLVLITSIYGEIKTLQTDWSDTVPCTMLHNNQPCYQLKQSHISYCNFNKNM